MPQPFSPARRAILLVCQVVMVLGGLAAIYAGSSVIVERYRHMAGLTSAAGQVTEVVSDHLNLSGKFAWHQYTLAVRIEGGPQVLASGVTSSTLRKGDRIPILYDPAGRQRAEVDTTTINVAEMSALIVVGLGLLAFALIAVPKIVRAGRR